MSKATINIHVQFVCVCVCGHTFASALGKPKSKAVGSYGKSTFSFLRKHQMVFQMAVPFCIVTSSD